MVLVGSMQWHLIQAKSLMHRLPIHRHHHHRLFRHHHHLHHQANVAISHIVQVERHVVAFWSYVISAWLMAVARMRMPFAAPEPYTAARASTLFATLKKDSASRFEMFGITLTQKFFKQKFLKFKEFNPLFDFYNPTIVMDF